MTELAILMVTREYPADCRYGLGRSVLPVVKELSRRGLRVGYLTQGGLPAARLERRARWLGRLAAGPAFGNPDLRPLAAAWLERLDVGWYAARLARSEGYTHVHLHDPWLAVGFWLGSVLLRLKAVRWGITEHGFGSYSRATQDDGLLQGPGTQWLMRRIESLVLKAAGWVVVPTDMALRQLASDLSVSGRPRHWHVIPHAQPAFPPMNRDAAREHLAWDTGAVYVVGVGRLVPLKRFDRLLEACLALAPDYPALHLCLLGDGPAAQDLKDRAATAGFGARLLIEATDDVAPYLAAADVYVSLSATESFGLANLEALGAGLPSICTAAGGVPEVVGEGACLIEGRLDEVIARLSEFLAAPGIRRDWTRRARQRVAAWPGIGEVADAYVALYQS